MCGKNYILNVGVMTEERSGTILNYFKMPKGKMNQIQVSQWQFFLASLDNKLTNKQFKFVCEIHADLFAHPYHEPCTCSPKRIKNWIAQITRIYEDRNSN